MYMYMYMQVYLHNRVGPSWCLVQTGLEQHKHKNLSLKNIEAVMSSVLDAVLGQAFESIIAVAFPEPRAQNSPGNPSRLGTAPAQ